MGKLPPRSQSSVAIRGSDGWVIVNASPDIGAQVRHLEPDGGFTADLRRFSPVEHVFLTNADLDHVLGIFQLREAGRICITAPDGVWRSLTEGLCLPQALASYGVIEHTVASTDWTEVHGLQVKAVPLKQAAPPPYSPDAKGSHGVGYLFRDSEEGKIAGIFPDVSDLDEELAEVLKGCELVFFDGTLWSDDELDRAGVGSKTARAMGHLPVSESVGALAALEIPKCGYLHINNTNPILRPDSVERAEVETYGLFVAEDGMSFSI